MAAFVRTTGTFQIKSGGGTSWALTPTNLPTVGNHIVMVCDGSGSPLLASSGIVKVANDSRGNRWVVLSTSISPYLVVGFIQTALQAGDTLIPVFNMGAGPIVATAAEFSGLVPPTTDEAKFMGVLDHRWNPSASWDLGNNSGTSLAPSIGTTGSETSPVSIPVGDLLIGATRVGGVIGDVFTQDTDTTNGTWATGVNTFTRIATAGGSATTNLTLNAQHKIITSQAPADQTYNPALGTSRAWTASLWGLAQAAPPKHPHGQVKKFVDAADVTVIGQAGQRSALWMKRRSRIFVPRLWAPAHGVV